MSNSRQKLLLTAGFALFGALLGIAGTGHAYLRRWRRSMLWFLITMGSFLLLMSVYVPEMDAIDPYDFFTYPTEVQIPVVVILSFSIVDAMLIAFLDQQQAAMTPGAAPESEADEGLSCPHCGRATDPDLDFCTWCTESLQQVDEYKHTDAE